MKPKNFSLSKKHFEPLRKLSEAQRATLLLALYQRHLGLELPKMDALTDLAFSFILASKVEDAKKAKETQPSTPPIAPAHLGTENEAKTEIEPPKPELNPEPQDTKKVASDTKHTPKPLPPLSRPLKTDLIPRSVKLKSNNIKIKISRKQLLRCYRRRSSA